MDGRRDGRSDRVPRLRCSRRRRPGLETPAGNPAQRQLFGPPADHRPARQAARQSGSGWWIAGKIEQRAYLGEYWEYVVRPAASDLRLRVSTPPTDMHDIDQDVWMEIDPTRIAAVPGPEGAAS